MVALQTASQKPKPTNSAILVINPIIYHVYSMLKQKKNIFEKICIKRCCPVLWNTVWILYASLKHVAKAEIQRNRNTKAIKTTTAKIKSLLESQGKKGRKNHRN